MLFSTDQLNRKLALPACPVKIVSVVPSLTELLFDLGLDEEVVGITKFCVHPNEWFRKKTRIGGTKKLEIYKILSLKPDLIIANKEENVEEQIQELASQVPVWISDIKDIHGALFMIEKVGELVCRHDEGIALAKNIQSFANEFSKRIDPLISAAYLIWKKPIMTVGGDTFISDMMMRAGFRNVFQGQKRYPEITFDDLISSNAEIIMLSSEPFPFKEDDQVDFQKLLPGMKVITVDGEMFSWYGSRLLKSFPYFKLLREKVISAL